MEQGDYSADFALEWAVKDLDLALAASGADTTPLVRSIAERWRGWSRKATDISTSAPRASD